MVHTTLTQRLRDTTRVAHAELEQLPYSRALADGTLPVESYVSHLRAMAIAHGVLERVLDSAKDDRIITAWQAGIRRLPDLGADLKHFGAQAIPDIPSVHQRAVTLTDSILHRSVQAPITLLGYLHVFEGSQMGAAVMAGMVKRIFPLDRLHGLTYLDMDAAATREHWQAFCAVIDTLSLTTEEERGVLDAALEAYAAVHQIFEALHPFDRSSLRHLVTSINPEAGAHPIPDDPLELDAAIRAGERCLLEYPYFTWRYGERGSRYTSSDSAWLATLTQRDQSIVDAQVQWLAGVLASRGMPSILMQRHLELLYEELVKRAPNASAERYGRLLLAAEALAQQRKGVMADSELDAIHRAFDEAVGPDWRVRLPRMGPVIACAVVDEVRGVAGAIASLETWLTDASRFPAQWIAAVQAAFSAARHAAQHSRR